MSEFRRIVVKFYFSETAKDAEPRLTKARELLTREGGNYDESSNTLGGGTRMVTFRARVPSTQCDKHHGFESVLNKGYPLGCGAGYVGDE